MISPIGSGDHDKVDRDIGLQSRVAETAHSVLAHRMASQQGQQAGPGREGNGNQGGRIDIAEISSEALEAVQKGGSGNSLSSLVTALEEAFQVREDRDAFSRESDGPKPGQQLGKIEENLTQTRTWEPTMTPGTVHTPGDEVGVIREEFDMERTIHGAEGAGSKGGGPDSKSAIDALQKKVQSGASSGGSTPEGRNSGSQVRIEGNRVVRESRINTENTGVNTEMRSAGILQQRSQSKQSDGDGNVAVEGTSQNNSNGVLGRYLKLDDRPNLTSAQVTSIQGMTTDMAADHLEQSAAKNPNEAHPGLAEEVQKLRSRQAD